MSETIDMTPTWEGVLPIFLAALEDASSKGKQIARGELLRMAQAADKWNAHVKAEQKAAEGFHHRA